MWPISCVMFVFPLILVYFSAVVTCAVCVLAALVVCASMGMLYIHTLIPKSYI